MLRGTDLSAGKYDTSLGIGTKTFVTGHADVSIGKFGTAKDFPTIEQDTLVLAHDKQQPAVRAVFALFHV